MKCACKNCLHELKGEPRDVTKEEAVCVVTAKGAHKYYHPDCYQADRDILEMIDVWLKDINKYGNVAQLRKTINTIVYTKKVPSDYLLFGLKYYVRNKIPLNYPGGLYYVIENRKVQDSWAKVQNAETKKQVEKTIKVDPVEFTFDLPDTLTPFKSNNKSKFSNVIGG